MLLLLLLVVVVVVVVQDRCPAAVGKHGHAGFHVVLRMRRSKQHKQTPTLSKSNSNSKNISNSISIIIDRIHAESNVVRSFCFFAPPVDWKSIHPVSITRFPLRRLSPGAGLLRNMFFHG